MSRRKSYPWFVERWPDLPEARRAAMADMARALRRHPLGPLSGLLGLIARAERELAGDRAALRDVIELAHALGNLDPELLRRLEQDRRCRHCGRPLKLVPLHERVYCDRACKAAARRRRVAGVPENAPGGRGRGKLRP